VCQKTDLIKQLELFRSKAGEVATDEVKQNYIRFILTYCTGMHQFKKFINKGKI